MPYTTVVAGTTISSSTYNTNVRDQVVTQTTSGARPGSPVAGMVIFETDTSLFQVYTGSAWIAFGGVGAYTVVTPTWSGLTVGNGTATGGWQQRGKMGLFWSTFTAGSTSAFTAAQPTTTLPFTAFATPFCGPLTAHFYDSSATQVYTVLPLLASTTTAKMQLATNDGSGHGGGQNFAAAAPVAMGTGDVLHIAGTLQIA